MMSQKPDNGLNEALVTVARFYGATILMVLVILVIAKILGVGVE